MGFIDAIILGLAQGLTEFLPVSSTGHLVLVRELFSISPEDALAFDAILHLATVMAVILYFSKDLWALLQTALRKLSRLPVSEKDMVMLYALMAGTVPALIVGFFLESIISNYLQTALFVAAFLFVAALFFVYAEWRYFQEPRQLSMTVRTGVLIGCFQVLALLPGFSRSGATIAGGMLLGLSRVESSRFSFLLAIPIILAVGLKKLLDLMGSETVVEWGPIAVGAVTAFISALLVIHLFLQFIRRYTLWPFVWYTIILALFVGYIVLVS